MAWPRENDYTGHGGTLTRTDNAAQVNRVQRWTLHQTVTRTRTRTKHLRDSINLKPVLERRSIVVRGSKATGGKNNPSDIRDTYARRGLITLGYVNRIAQTSRLSRNQSAAKDPARWRVCGASQNRLVVKSYRPHRLEGGRLQLDKVRQIVIQGYQRWRILAFTE